MREGRWRLSAWWGPRSALADKPGLSEADRPLRLRGSRWTSSTDTWTALADRFRRRSRRYGRLEPQYLRRMRQGRLTVRDEKHSDP